MMPRALAVILVLATGCGTTFVVPNEAGARVWVDGEMVGKGQGTVNQRGFPGRAQVLVKTDDGRRQQASMKRSFTAVTFLLGLITYGVCWVACWEYPGSLLVELPPGPGGRPPGPGGGYASGPAPDPWLQPPPGWQARVPAAPVPND
jgi:hypothetical protein